MVVFLLLIRIIVYFICITFLKEEKKRNEMINRKLKAVRDF